LAYIYPIATGSLSKSVLSGRETPMKALYIATLIAFGFATCCAAQEPSSSKPPILLESKKEPSALMNQNCVDVEIGGDKAPSLGCLNRKLKQQVDNIQPSVNSPPLDARSQDNRIGIVNAATARQQLAPRPPTPIFPNLRH
jgi:hypothetical protein